MPCALFFFEKDSIAYIWLFCASLYDLFEKCKRNIPQYNCPPNPWRTLMLYIPKKPINSKFIDMSLTALKYLNDNISAGNVAPHQWKNSALFLYLSFALLDVFSVVRIILRKVRNHLEIIFKKMSFWYLLVARSWKFWLK